MIKTLLASLLISTSLTTSGINTNNLNEYVVTYNNGLQVLIQSQLEILELNDLIINSEENCQWTFDENLTWYKGNDYYPVYMQKGENLVESYIELNNIKTIREVE